MHKEHILWITFLFSITFAIYYNSLDNPFIYDDKLTIVENIYIKDLKNIKHIFTKEYSMSAGGMPGEITYRPISTLTYLLDYLVYGMNARGFHLTNIFLHFLSSTLSYFLVLSVSKNFVLSCISSLLWAIHPIHTESVNVVSFRWDIIVTIFSLLSTIAFIKGYNRQKHFLYIISLLSFFIAIFSKEVAIITPFIILMHSLIYNRIDEIVKQKYYYASFFLIIIFYVYVVQFVAHNPLREIKYYEGSAIVTFFTMSKVFVWYIYNLVFPINLYADYKISFSHSLDFKVIFSLFVIITIFIAGFFLQKRHKEVSFGIFFFIIGFLPVSNIIPFGNLMRDRYMYIPSLGFCIVLSYLLVNLLKNKNTLIVVVFLISLAYCAKTISQNTLWQDEINVWRNVEKKFPDSYIANYSIGSIYLERGEMKKALHYLKKAAKLNPYDARVYNNIGVIYASLNMPEDALKYYNIALNLNPKNIKALNNSGIVYYNLGEYDKAIYFYTKAIRINPHYADAYNNRGNAYAKTSNCKKAIEDYTSAIKINPEFTIAYKNRGITYLKCGKKELAMKDFAIAESIENE